MSSVFLFVIVLFISFIVVRIGAIGFQLTGLEWSLAKFQSLSCFTGTGFTTKEAELITGNHQRRRIASVLMILGNAGLVILIATFVSSMVPQEGTFVLKLTESYLPFSIPPRLVIFVNLGLIILGAYAVYRFSTNKKIVDKLTTYLRRRIIRTEQFQRVSVEELLMATGGYGVSRVVVRKDSPVLNKSLLQTALSKQGVMVLAVVRDSETTANPPADTKLLLGDELLCFGKLSNIREKICGG